LGSDIPAGLIEPSNGTLRNDLQRQGKIELLRGPKGYVMGPHGRAMAISLQVFKVTGNSRHLYQSGVEIAYPFGAQAAPPKCTKDSTVWGS